MNENICKEESLKCLGCHSFKLITDFNYNKNGGMFKTCNKCRIRNKARASMKTIIKQQPCEIVLSEEEIEQRRIVDMVADKNLILTAKSKTKFFRTLLTYTHSKGVKVEMLSGIDIYDRKEIIKMVFSLTRSMIIIKCYDNWCKIKRLIDEELKTDKTAECSIGLNSYEIIQHTDNSKHTKARMRCIKCYNDYCITCFFCKLYAKNEGLIICPLCRDQSGRETFNYGSAGSMASTFYYNVFKNKHVHIPYNFSKAL